MSTRPQSGDVFEKAAEIVFRIAGGNALCHLAILAKTIAWVCFLAVIRSRLAALNCATAELSEV
jgi:hypothetical protein